MPSSLFSYMGTICLSKVDVPMICMDVANGYSEHFVQAVRKMREAHPTRTIVAGNVVSQ